MSDLAPELRAKAYPLECLLRDKASFASPMNGRDICRALEITSTENLRNLVNWMRSAGNSSSLIGSDRRGYFLITNDAEFETTRAHLHSRMAAMDEAVRGLCRAFKRSEKQTGMVL